MKQEILHYSDVYVNVRYTDSSCVQQYIIEIMKKKFHFQFIVKVT